MKLFKVLTIVLLFFFSTAALYSQAPPPVEEIKEEQKAGAGPGPAPDPDGPPQGTSVPLDGAMILALLAGGGVVAGLMRKSTKKKD